jgi:HAD superfamily hydrolase (TIGR01509 family)
MRQAMVDAYDYLPGIVPLLEDLSGRDLHLLSNYPVWYRLIENKLKLSRYAKWSFVSCELGVRKPDPAIFHIACDTLELPAERLLFVDDRERNTSAAAELGMDTILFESAPQLRRELRERSLVR